MTQWLEGKELGRIIDKAKMRIINSGDYYEAKRCIDVENIIKIPILTRNIAAVMGKERWMKFHDYQRRYMRALLAEEVCKEMNWTPPRAIYKYMSGWNRKCIVKPEPVICPQPPTPEQVKAMRAKSDKLLDEFLDGIPDPMFDIPNIKLPKGAKVMDTSDLWNIPTLKIGETLLNPHVHDSGERIGAVTGMPLEGAIYDIQINGVSVNPCAEIILTGPEKCTLGTTEEKLMQVTRPVMIAGHNILDCAESTLTSLIRNAQQQIKNNEDLAKISESYKAKQKELEQVIKLCVEQLDKDIKPKRTRKSSKQAAQTGG